MLFIIIFVFTADLYRYHAYDDKIKNYDKNSQITCNYTRTPGYRLNNISLLSSISQQLFA